MENSFEAEKLRSKSKSHLKLFIEEDQERDSVEQFEMVIEETDKTEKENSSQSPSRTPSGGHTSDKQSELQKSPLRSPKPERKNTDELCQDTVKLIEESAAFLDINSPVKGARGGLKNGGSELDFLEKTEEDHIGELIDFADWLLDEELFLTVPIKRGGGGRVYMRSVGPCGAGGGN
jgi:hypothetical protein